MLRFFCWLLGKDYGLVSLYRQSSKEKIILFGSILLIPVILWGINGYLMSKEIFGLGLYGSLGTSFILSLLIYLIERSIILSTTNKLITRLRILIGSIVAILGSLTMDEVIFKNDIDNMMQTYKVEGVDSEVKKIDDFYQNKRDSISRIANQKFQIKEKARVDLQKELEGQANSGMGGDGPLAKIKRQLFDDAQKDYDDERQKLTNLQDSYNDERKYAKVDTREKFNDKGLLIRMKAMFRLIMSDWVSFCVFILYFTLVFIMEILVIVMKKFTPQSPDEELEKLGDLLLIARRQKLLKMRMETYGLEIKKDFSEQTNLKLEK
jgi:hypothetical protein